MFSLSHCPADVTTQLPLVPRFLTMLDINYFLRAISRETLEIVGTQVNVEDVKDELFDIVKPAHPDRITVDDLIACRQGGTGLKFALLTVLV